MTILESTFEKLPAGANLLFLGEYGSSAHGVNTSDSDFDFIGVAVEPPSVFHGLDTYEHTLVGDSDTGSRTAAGAEEGKVFALKKFARLVEGGNTDVLASLFLPEYRFMSDAGNFLIQNRSLFVTLQAIKRFSGHLSTERRRMNGDIREKVLRPELIAEFGFDTKAAYQAVKLGFHGRRIARDKTMSIPFTGEERDFILAVRAGEITRKEIDEFLEDIVHELDVTEASDSLPERPDRVRINAVLREIYRMTDE